MCTSSSPDVLKCNYASIATNISSRDPTIIQFFNFDWNLEEATNDSNQYVADKTDEKDYRAIIIALDKNVEGCLHCLCQEITICKTRATIHSGKKIVILWTWLFT